MMEVRNLRHTNNGMIDCEYNHPKFGWIPFTASGEDIELFNRANLGEFGDILPAPPIVSAIPECVSMKQARLVLLQNGLLSAVNAVILTMPEAAQIEWEFSADVHRENALVIAMQSLLGWTDAQMDDLFILAAGL